IVIIEPQFFIQYVTIANQQYNLPQINLIEKVLEVWLDKFDNIGHPKQRKLNAMAFATIITTTNPIILGYLQQFIGIWCDVLSEVRESGGGDTLVYWREEYSIESDERDDTPETKRKRALLQRDPIHTTNLIQYIRTKIAECEAINGGSQLFNQNYIRTVDSTLLDQLNVVGHPNNLYLPSYTCQSDTFYTKTPVHDPSTAISSIYTSIFNTKTCYSGLLIIGWTDRDIVSQLLEDWHKGGSGYQSSLIHMYGKKQDLYISSIEDNICKIEVYQDSQLKQAVEGASSNDVWKNFSISKYIGIQLFSLDYAVT
ncbi:13785_t:CDS:2, partial [Cetraspora pellucida]